MKKYNNDVELPILDSRLISPTLVNDIPKIYNIKIVECGSYQQIYCYDKVKIKRPKKDKDNELNLYKINVNTSNSKTNTFTLKEIEERNIIRSKLSCQRIAKTNMECWKSFITLTFEENIKDVKFANKRFQYFVDKVRRVNKDFKYLCITEFQKRGAIHYHLLTNIECDSSIIPKRPLKHLYKPSINAYIDLEYYDIKYWLDGFSSAEPINDDPKKVIGYISKYMTKDIDQRLFSKHRYFYSKNLNVPKIEYIDLNNNEDYEFYIKKIQDKELIYQNEYIDKYNDIKVQFLELQ